MPGLRLATLVWVMSACVWQPPSTVTGAEPANPAPYAYGTIVSFAKGGNSEPFRTSGWSVTEEKFTWTEGHAATFTARVLPASEAIALRMKIAGMIKTPELPVQSVEVSINGKKIAEWEIADTAQFTAAVPPELLREGGDLILTLRIPKATSPKALGVSADPRVLGVCVFDLELSKAPGAKS